MRLRPLAAGEPITESWIASLVREVQRALSITAAPPLSVQRDASGVRLFMPQPYQRRWVRLTERLDKDHPAKGVLQSYDSDSEEWTDEGTNEIEVVVGPLGAGGGSAEQIVPVYSDFVIGKWVLDVSGQVGKFVAKENWNANNVIQARQLVWNGSTFQEGADLEIRDYMGLGGKSGMRGAYFVEDGELWHLATPCPPQETQTPTQTFA